MGMPQTPEISARSRHPLGSVLLRPEIITLLLLVVFDAYLIASSEGFHKIDEGAHFINNVDVLKEPSISIGVWQRFGRVWLFALPAQVGHKTVKVFASLLFLLTIYITYKVAEAEEIPGKEWIVALVAFQPVFLDISYTCFAELPAALLLILSYYLFRKSQWSLSLLSASLVFLFRFEMSIVAVILFLLAAPKRRYAALPCVLVGPALWLLAAWHFTGNPWWLPMEFIRFSHYPKYIEGTALNHYLSNAGEIFGVVQIGLVAVFLLYDLFEKRIQLPFITFIVLYCLFINMAAASREFHWTGSVGDLRYLTPVAPFVGIMALSGLSAFVKSLKVTTVTRFVPHILAAIAVLSATTTVKPHHLVPMELAVMNMSREASSDSSNIPILTNHWAAKFALLNNQHEANRILALSMKTYTDNADAYIIWDSQMAESPFSQQALTLNDVRHDRHVKAVDSVTVYNQFVLLFLKKAHKNS
jgi:hypothetical protein